ncbi:hypothetical protein ACFVSN_44190 [Kitasatospora sp. NPDC057904]|uniref:hypothetical protein n=1 Tax=Kitasatospora sp. NPDC057904 TaxID=3346275 RepID=UPI0036DBCB6B
MKKIAVLAALASAALCLTAPAHAASGDLVLNGRIFANPSGCYRELNAPLSVQNRTGTVAYVFASRDCTGPAQTVPARQSVSSAGGHSVRIS